MVTIRMLSNGEWIADDGGAASIIAHRSEFLARKFWEHWSSKYVYMPYWGG